MRACSISGCEKVHLARGFCSRHYNAWLKHDDPLKRVKEERGAALRWMAQLAAAPGVDKCVEWPFKSRFGKGYGSTWFDGRRMGAHHAMCIIAKGPAPVGMDCAHSCGNRICVNPRHLRWATPIENEADKLIHGTRTWAKLADGDVRKILALINQGKTQQEIADEFQISRANISNISRGLTWKHIARMAA